MPGSLPNPQAEPALRICAALEADARARAEARRTGVPHRQAPVLPPVDRSRLVAQLAQGLAPVLPGGDGSGAGADGADVASSCGARTAASAWPPRRDKSGASSGVAKPVAAAAGTGGAGQPRYGGVAGALLELVDSILVLDAVHRPELREVSRRVARVLEALPAQAAA